MPHHPRCGNVGTETLNPNETKKKKGGTKDAQKGGKDTPTFWEGTQNAVLSLK